MNVYTVKVVPKNNIFRPLTRNKSSSEYCVNMVKQHDYENFMCTLLLKDQTRSSAFAIRSFNIELAKISDHVSQANIGQMRMKFWEDLLDKCYTKDISQVPHHPVAIELYKAIMRSKLTKRHFNTLISSRKERLHLDSIQKIGDMEKYADQTVSCVYFLLLEAGDVRNVNADHAASHLGKAQGILQQLRSIRYAKQLNCITMPQELLNKYKVSHEEVLRGTSSNRLTECTFEVASRAHQHLAKARSLAEKVPDNARAVLLPAIVVDNYLNRLQKADYDLFHPSLSNRAWIWLPKLWVASVRNKY